MTTLAHTFSRLALLGGAFLFPGVSHAENFARAPLELVAYGFFCPQMTTGTRDAPETERGVIDLIEGEVSPEIVTRRIPAELGASFGIRYKLADGLGTAQVMVTNAHPPFGQPPVTLDRYFTTVWDNDASVALFTFDSEYEIQLGTWTYSIILDGEVLIQQSFEVVPPEMTEASVSMCAGPSMMM